MGDENSVSSLHKDHYENLYFVIRGEKHFTLFPPTDRPFLQHKNFHSAIYQPIEEENKNSTFVDTMLKRKFKVGDFSEEASVPWIAVDPDFPDYSKFPNYSKVILISHYLFIM